MKKISLLLVVLLLNQVITFSQPCLPEGITFNTQEQIDNFQTNYPDCTEIEGSINISGLDDINNLSGLNVLTSIGGSLEIIGNSNLTSLTGLDSLITIGGIVIMGNSTLTSLEGLNNVTSVELIRIFLNSALSSLAGLENVTSIGDLEIRNNDSLTNLTGLENLTYIGFNLVIIANDALSSLAGLENVTSIGASLEIEGNNSLTSLAGLNNVTSIGQYIYIIDIRGNPDLTSLYGLGNLSPEGIEELAIVDNESLSYCEVQSICNHLSGWALIGNNADGCNSVEEVEEACSSSIDEVNHLTKFSVYPNPITASTTIEFSLIKPETVTILIYNHIGELVEVICEKYIQGLQKVEWDLEYLPASVYFCTLKTSEGIQTKKIIKL